MRCFCCQDVLVVFFLNHHNRFDQSATIYQSIPNCRGWKSHQKVSWIWSWLYCTFYDVVCVHYMYIIYNHIYIYVYQICSHIKPYAYKRVEHFERAKLHHFGWSLNKEIMAESRGSLKHVPSCIKCQSACVYWSPTGTLAGCVALLKSWMPLKTWTNHLERCPACPGQAVNITKKSSDVCNGQKTGDSLAGLKVIIQYIAQLGFVEASLTSSCPSLP